MNERLRNVELFATGTYRGREYTLADLNQMARNAKKLGPRKMDLIEPPAVLGHEETQEFLERTDLPAAAWLDTDTVHVRTYHEPITGKTEGILVGDFTEVAPAIAKLIRQKRYKRCSAEIYDDFTDDFGNSHGKALRRIAFLGGEVPQVKRLADLPMPTTFAEMTDQRPTRLVPAGSATTKAGTVLCFAEVTAMNRDQMLAAISAAMPGLNPATLQGMSDDMLADLVKNLPTPAAAATPPADPATALMADIDPATATREEMIATLEGQGEDPATLQAMTEDDLRAMLSDSSTQTFADDPAAMDRTALMSALQGLGEEPADLEPLSDDELRELYAQLSGSGADNPGSTPPPGGAVPMSERQRQARRQPVQTYAERANNLARANLRQAVKTHTASKKHDAVTFCEQMVREGRMTPAQKPFFLESLLAKDNVRVQRFSEGGKTLLMTAYEKKKAEIAALAPVVRFGERVQAGAADAKTQVAAEVNKVERFAEMYGDSLRTAGSDPKTLVETAKKMAANDPKFTAASLIGADAVKMVG